MPQFFLISAVIEFLQIYNSIKLINTKVNLQIQSAKKMHKFLQQKSKDSVGEQKNVTKCHVFRKTCIKFGNSDQV